MEPTMNKNGNSQGETTPVMQAEKFCKEFPTIESWLTYRWLTEDEEPRIFWEVRASTIANHYTDANLAIQQLAKEILDSVKAECRTNSGSLAEDLLQAALWEVSWCDVAKALLKNKLPPEMQIDSLFPLGNVVATPGVLECVPLDERLVALARYGRGDWGEVDGVDWSENESALRQGSRLFSEYRSRAGVIFLIITEADRSTTTILLPGEY